MKRFAVLALISLLLLSGIALLPAPTARAAETTVQHELLPSENITEESIYYKVTYPHGIIHIVKESGSSPGTLWFYDTSETTMISGWKPEVGSYPLSFHSMSYDATNRTFNIEFKNDTGVTADVTVTLYSDSIFYDVQVTNLPAPTEEKQVNFPRIDYGIGTDVTLYTFDFGTFNDVERDILNLPIWKATNINTGIFVYETYTNVMNFNYVGSTYFGISRGIMGQYALPYLFPALDWHFSIVIKFDSPNKKTIDVFPVAYPHGYGRDATFSFTTDDGPPYVNTKMIHNLTKYLNDRNIYVTYFTWWKYNKTSTDGTPDTYFYKDTEYYNELKSMMSKGNVVGFHTPTMNDDTANTFSTALADWKAYLGSDAMLIYQGHDNNKERIFKEGANSSSDYYIYPVVADNFEFFQNQYITPASSNYWIEYRYPYIRPISVNSSTDDYGKILYAERVEIWGDPDQIYGNNGEAVDNFVHDLIVYHNAYSLFSHMWEDDWEGGKPWVYTNGTINPIVKELFNKIYENHSKIWTPNAYTFYKYMWIWENLQLDTVDFSTIKVTNPTQYSTDGMGIIVPSDYRSAYINGKEVPVVQKDGFNVVVFSIDAGQTLYIKLSKNAPTYELLSANIGEQHVNMYRDENKIVIKVAGHGTGHLRLKVPFANPSVIASDIYLNVASTSKVMDLDIQAGHTYEIYEDTSGAGGAGDTTSSDILASIGDFVVHHFLTIAFAVLALLSIPGRNWKLFIFFALLAVASYFVFDSYVMQWLGGGG